MGPLEITDILSSPSSDHVFLCFAPSLVAAACVATSRLILHLSPTWPPRLQLLTGYSWENLIPCAEKLLMCVSVCRLKSQIAPEQDADTSQYMLTQWALVQQMAAAH